MWTAQTKAYSIQVSTLNQATEKVQMSGAFLNINSDSIIYLQFTAVNEKSGLVSLSAIYYCFNPYIGKTFTFTFFIWWFFVMIIIDIAGGVYVIHNVWRIIKGTDDENDEPLNTNDRLLKQKETTSQKCKNFFRCCCCKKTSLATQITLQKYVGTDYKEKMGFLIEELEADRRKSKKVINILNGGRKKDLGYKVKVSAWNILLIELVNMKYIPSLISTSAVIAMIVFLFQFLEDTKYWNDNSFNSRNSMDGDDAWQMKYHHRL